MVRVFAINNFEMGVTMRSFLTAAAVCLAAQASPAQHDHAMRSPAISGVTASRSTFNPTLSESTTLHCTTAVAGSLTVRVVDRDGVEVRRLRNDAPVRADAHTIPWDGRDSAGAVVPDEAYSFKIDLRTRAGSASYFPAADPVTMDFVAPAEYDRFNGTLRYRLPLPSRVHIQAGISRPTTEGQDGPVLRTIVNRAPRAAGEVVEHWLGYDESGTIFIPELEGFAISIATTPLPENAVITVGNRSETFLAYTADRAGTSLLPPPTTAPHHHLGLSAAEDVSPHLEIIPLNARFDGEARTWITSDDVVKVKIRLRGPTAATFATHPGLVVAFMDGERVATLPKGEQDIVLNVPQDKRPHILAVNWGTGRGPAAANSCRVESRRER